MSAYLRTSMPQPSRIDYDRIKRNAFHDEGILVVSLDNPGLPWQDRELLKSIGERLYGKPRIQAPALRSVR